MKDYYQDNSNLMEFYSNVLNINGETITFQHDIETILQIQNNILVLLDVDGSASEADTANNVFGVKNGKIVWQVEDARNYIKNCPFSFSYTLMRQIDDEKVMLTDFNGFRILIDSNTGKIIPNDNRVPVEEE